MFFRCTKNHTHIQQQSSLHTKETAICRRAKVYLITSKRKARSDFLLIPSERGARSEFLLIYTKNLSMSGVVTLLRGLFRRRLSAEGARSRSQTIDGNPELGHVCM